MKRDSVYDRMIGWSDEARELWPKSRSLREKRHHLKWMAMWIVKADRYRNDVERLK